MAVKIMSRAKASPRGFASEPDAGDLPDGWSFCPQCGQPMSVAGCEDCAWQQQMADALAGAERRRYAWALGEAPIVDSIDEFGRKVPATV